jgi:hypothetical protein
VLLARKKGGCEKKLWAGGDRCLSTVWGDGMGRRHAAGLGEGTRCRTAAAAGLLEPDRGGNGQAAHVHVAGTKIGEVGCQVGPCYSPGRRGQTV